MAVVPPNLLPPESQPWARDRDAAIAQLQFDVAKNAQTTDNSFTAVNQALATISKQVADIAVAVAKSNQAAADAAAAAATANSAIANLVTGTNYTAVDNSGFGVGTSDTDLCAGSVTVPSGYSKATVLLVAVAAAYNTRASSDFLYLSAVIQGVKSREIPTFVPATTNADVTTASSVYLTGLTGGGTITLGCRAHAQGGAWGTVAANRYSVEAIITFFK